MQQRRIETDQIYQEALERGVEQFFIGSSAPGGGILHSSGHGFSLLEGEVKAFENSGVEVSNSRYTQSVEMTVSLPDEVFEAAEHPTLETNQIDPLTEAINLVADRVDTRLEPGLKQLQRATLERQR